MVVEELAEENCCLSAGRDVTPGEKAEAVVAKHAMSSSSRLAEVIEISSRELRHSVLNVKVDESRSEARSAHASRSARSWLGRESSR